MSQLPSLEADELVAKQLLRAEIAEVRTEVRGDVATVRRLRCRTPSPH